MSTAALTRPAWTPPVTRQSWTQPILLALYLTLSVVAAAILLGTLYAAPTRLHSRPRRAALDNDRRSGRTS